MARSKRSKEVVNTASRLLVRGGYTFDGFIDWQAWPGGPKRKRFILGDTGQRASVGPRSTYFYRSIGALRRGAPGAGDGVKVKSTNLEEIARVMEERKASVGCGA